MFPPENTCTNPHLLPRALAWSTDYRRAKERRGEVMTFRRWLDSITGVTRTETYTRVELEQFTVPDTDLEKYLQRTPDYAAYRDRYLATSLGVERELERRFAEAEARRARREAGGEAGDDTGEETGARGRGGRSSRGRGRGARPSVGGRGVGIPGRAGLPTLDWSIGVRDLSGARAMLDIPRLPHRPMRLPAQVPREWAEQAIMLMVGITA
ncbi:hypothetical protein RHMOL_Rhmol11G0016800 [Rhododendron molle]|uniref:Uncharacterized protein n=1 Tax=Rhododendron molle TaxID=49168 RepID=A0ACC0LP98_RHOML|nr:hypothetical protein RHMOL_Rhmol11G0016800 [Rhododendron molle]